MKNNLAVAILLLMAPAICFAQSSFVTPFTPNFASCKDVAITTTAVAIPVPVPPVNSAPYQNVLFSNPSVALHWTVNSVAATTNGLALASGAGQYVYGIFGSTLSLASDAGSGTVNVCFGAGN